MLITEPKWKKWVVETIGPIFTLKLCQEIIDLNKTLPHEEGKVLGKEIGIYGSRRKSTISWIPFNKMQPMYDEINTFIQKTNRNHFGFGDIQITEMAQVAEYSKGGFYEWHTDTSLDMDKEPPVRKLSMTLLLNDPSEFEGGNLEIANRTLTPMKQGHAAIYASFLQHQVTPVTHGTRRSLVMWFGGEPFK
jgi:PKHD-type hydroxylase